MRLSLAQTRSRSFCRNLHAASSFATLLGYAESLPAILRCHARTQALSIRAFNVRMSPLSLSVTMKLRFATGLLVLLVNCSPGYGQTMKAPPAETFPRFSVEEGQLDQDGFPTSGAKLCLVVSKDGCYQMPSHTSDGLGRVTYEFGLEPHSNILPLTNGGSWAFFSAMFSAGGSGTLTRLAIMRYQTGEGNGGVLVNLLPYIAVTNASEYAVWTIPSASPYPVLVHADFIWGSGETHFAPHYYTVDAWRFDMATDCYRKAVSYRTSKKYEGGDSGSVSVLGPERSEILRRLSTR